MSDFTGILRYSRKTVRNQIVFTRAARVIAVIVSLCVCVCVCVCLSRAGDVSKGLNMGS